MLFISCILSESEMSQETVLSHAYNSCFVLKGESVFKQQMRLQVSSSSSHEISPEVRCAIFATLARKQHLMTPKLIHIIYVLF